MSKAKTNHMIIKRIVDAVMTVLLLCLMAYQVTGEMAHEWIGMGMTVLVILWHHENADGSLFPDCDVVGLDDQNRSEQ